jgi:hypothetical protein
MKYLKSFKKITESKSENIKGFERKLMEIVESDKVQKILDLIPDGVILPLFYKGDIVNLVEGGSVTITDSSYKNGEYIYYYELDEDEVYSYESDFEF